MDGDFKRYYDQDPLGTFPEYEAKYLTLSAQLAQGEGRIAAALEFYREVITSPYFRREYDGYVDATHVLFKQTGGSEAAWAAFSKVAPMPDGVPSGFSGVPFSSWIKLDYKLPEVNVPGLDSHAWTAKDFEGKTTFVFLWSFGGMQSFAPALQALYNAIQTRPDLQMVALWPLSGDARDFTSYMRQNGFTFPVMMGKPLFWQGTFGQTWIVDRTGSIRLYSATNHFLGAEKAFAAEAVYKLNQVSAR